MSPVYRDGEDPEPSARRVGGEAPSPVSADGDRGLGGHAVSGASGEQLVSSRDWALSAVYDCVGLPPDDLQVFLLLYYSQA